MIQSSFSFEYFNENISYWSTPKDKNIEKKQAYKSKIQEKNDFSWNEYLDPNKDHMFKEGNYTPPKPFLELLRNPNDKNIKNWFKLIKTKNDLARNLSVKINEYVKRNQKNVSPSLRQEISAKLKKIKPKAENIEDYRLVLYIDSKCPYCKKMIKTMRDLQHIGYYIELRQIDDDFSETKKLPLILKKAKKEEISKNKIMSVPLLLIGNKKEKTFFRISGYRTTKEVLAAIQTQP